MVQHQVTCFRLAINLTLTTLTTYKTILIPQARTLLTSPHFAWRSGTAHASNPFNPIPMKILIWNCRGVSNLFFCHSFSDLIRSHCPAIAAIMETCISGQRAEDVSSSLDFENVCCLDVVSFRSGIWVLWNERDTNLEILSMTDQAIHAFVQVSVLNPSSN